MKPNKYCHIVKFNDSHHVIFNGVTKEFIFISNEKVPSYKEIIDNPEVYQFSHPGVIKQLKDLGAVIDDDLDIKGILKRERENYINSKEYKTTILPTYECNYACWYCIQKHVPTKIDMYIFDLIIKHVKKYIIENNIESYILSWFGGEPLTQPQIIDYVGHNLISFCNENNIAFASGITTNGALLNDETIQMLKRNMVNYYQISIDGDEKSHNKNKYDDKAPSSFALILNNICHLLDINPKADIVLRINYTLSTLKSKSIVMDICKYIPWPLRYRITVELQKVWQIKETLVPITDLCTLQQKFVENGFKLATNHVFSMCYVEKKHYNMIYYNGGVEKCDKRPLDSLRGHLNNEGDIVWNETPIFHSYDLFSENSVCSNCTYYPLCYNGCPMERENRIKEHGHIICGHCGQYDLLNLRILDYCWRKINNMRLKTNDE